MMIMLLSFELLAGVISCMSRIMMFMFATVHGSTCCYPDRSKPAKEGTAQSMYQAVLSAQARSVPTCV